MNNQHLIPYNLLLADDHRLITDGIGSILKEEPMVGKIYMAQNGIEAVEMVMQYDIDCVIMDINMPELNGVEATRRIRKYKPDTRILAVSMLSDPAIVSKMIKAGASGFIHKDAGKAELMLAIRKVMYGERYIGSHIADNLIEHLARHGPDEPEKPLTEREREIVRYIASGMTNREIAAKLFLSVATVHTHRKNILAKLQLKNSAALVKYAAENGLL